MMDNTADLPQGRADRPAYCDLTRGRPCGACSCTVRTGCTYLGVFSTCGPVVVDTRREAPGGAG